MSKFTNGERSLVKNIVANLTIKRIAEEDIIKVIFDQTGKSITRKEIWNIRERIKRLAELHRLTISLSNLYDLAPTIIGEGKDATISITPETKSSTTTNEFIV